MGSNRDTPYLVPISMHKKTSLATYSGFGPLFWILLLGSRYQESIDALKVGSIYMPQVSSTCLSDMSSGIEPDSKAPKDPNMVYIWFLY